MAEAQQQDGQPIRPRSVTLVIWGVFLLGLANAWRAAGINRQSSFLSDLELVPDPRLSWIMALVWTVVFLVTAVALRQANKVARLVTPLLLLVYALYRLALMPFFVQSVDFYRSWPINGALAALAILYAAWALNRKAGRRYFESRE